MDAFEKESVHNYVKGLLLQTSQSHYPNCNQERSFTREQVIHAVKYGDLIEVNNDREPYIRALFRDRTGTCVVVSLGSGDIIRVYQDNPEKNRDALSMGLYRWQVDLLSVIDALKK